MKPFRPYSGFFWNTSILLCSVSAFSIAKAQQSTATIAGQTWTLRSDLTVSAGRASAVIGGSTYELIPQTVGSPFAGTGTTGEFRLVSGGASAFSSDRLDDYSIWARFEFANPALPSAQPSADADNDGQNNQFEWLSLTDPENASSRLRLEVSLLSSSQIRLTLEPYFPAQRNYSFLGSTTLSTGAFTTFDTDLGPAPGNPPRATQDVPVNAAEPRRFFKAGIEIKP
jgi:hypothetical protein